jgi:hypothetical protein
MKVVEWVPCVENAYSGFFFMLQTTGKKTPTLCCILQSWDLLELNN